MIMVLSSLAYNNTPRLHTHTRAREKHGLCRIMLPDSDQLGLVLRITQKRSSEFCNFVVCINLPMDMAMFEFLFCWPYDCSSIYTAACCSCAIVMQPPGDGNTVSKMHVFIASDVNCVPRVQMAS